MAAVTNRDAARKRKEEPAMLDAFATSGTSPTYRYRVRELRYNVVREGDAPPRDLSGPIAYVARWIWRLWR